jgi:hypothetical protein
MPTLRLVQEAIDPSGTHRVAVELQVEQRLVELGRDLFGQVFQVREATRLWDRAEPGQGPVLDGRASISGSSGLPALMARIGPNPVEPAPPA